MSSSNFKHDLFAQFARVGKALSNANRLVLLEYIALGERSVEAAGHGIRTDGSQCFPAPAAVASGWSGELPQARLLTPEVIPEVVRKAFAVFLPVRSVSMR